MSSWESLVPARGFSYADPCSAAYANKWAPNSRNPLICFLLNNVPQAKHILRFVAGDSEGLKQLERTSRYLDSIDVYLIPDRPKDGIR